MITLILSDLHLGSPLFSSNEDDCINLLNNTEFDRLILIGDIIDTWESSIKSIKRKHGFIIDLINSFGNKVVYIKGNHDPDYNDISALFPLAWCLDRLVIYSTDNVYKYLIIHGHQFDFMIQKYNILMRIFHMIHWVFERIGINIKAALRIFNHSLSALRQKKYYYDLVSSMEQEAVKTYRNQYDGIIMGHTHLPKKITEDNSGFLYVNSGDWVYNKTWVTFNGSEFQLIGNIKEIKHD